MSESQETCGGVNVKDVEPKVEGGEWAWTASHQERHRVLPMSEFLSDFTLILGPEKVKVPVHLLYLRSGSRVFFNKISPGQTELLIDTVDPRVFKLLLQYLYTGDSGVGLSDAAALLKIATDFEVPELANHCAKLLQSKLTEENVLSLFQEGMKYGHDDLFESTVKFICRMGCKILKREEFANLGLKCLLEVLQKDELQVKDEITVFEAVCRWGKAECERNGVDGTDPKELRKVLEEPLKQIRFPLMDKEEFSIRVASKNILNSEELIGLLACFQVSPEKRHLLPEGRWPSTPRLSCFVNNPTMECGCDPRPDIVKLYRYYHPRGHHYYIADWSELEDGNDEWIFEGVACQVYLSFVLGTVPLHRYTSKSGLGSYQYTTDWSELGGGTSAFVYRGVAGFIYPSHSPGTVPLHKYYNSKYNDYFFTTNLEELGDGGGDWTRNGIAGYVFPYKFNCTKTDTSKPARIAEAARPSVGSEKRKKEMKGERKRSITSLTKKVKHVHKDADENEERDLDYHLFGDGSDD